MIKNWFNLSAGVILLVTAAAKILGSLGHAEILRRVDPIFEMEFGRLMLIAGIVELLVACICFFSRRRIVGHVATAWLATCLLIYRAGLWWIGWRRPCHCLGDFTDALHIPPQTADTAMKFILAYLLLGSYASLFWLWRQNRKAVSALALSGASTPPPAP